MKEIKEQFKKDFEESNNVDLSFDTNQLENNTKKNRHYVKPYKKALIITSSILVAVIVIAFIPFATVLFRVEESVRSYNRKYTLNEMALAESNTFKKINEVSYPSGTEPVFSRISSGEKEAYSNFSNLTYHSLIDTSKKDNMSYSIVGLYSVMNELTYAASREDLKTRLNTLLGLNENSRVSFYDKVMKANSFAMNDSTIQLKNAAFFDDKFAYNQTFVDALTRLYCEAYQLHFKTESRKITEWVNKAVNASNFIDKEFLELDDETMLYLFSTLYFKNAWGSKYLSENNIVDKFYLSNGSTIDTTYMRHSYLSQAYYDYGSYVSVKDYYHRGVASITYLVPKKTSDNIFDLTKEVNIFIENENNKVEHNANGYININLTTPKFNNKCDINFQVALENLGFSDIFDKNMDSFKGAISGDNNSDYKLYIQTVKQRNEVEFNEDGSIIRSVTMASFGGNTAAHMSNDTLDVSLNQPFIYIIKDINDTPIFVGHVDNPKAN